MPELLYSQGKSMKYSSVRGWVAPRADLDVLVMRKTVMSGL
jgi:hypothetical protein